MSEETEHHHETLRRDLSGADGTPIENRDLSHLPSFEAVKQELGLQLRDDGLYRNPQGRIVLFRGQQNDYPDTLRASTDPRASGGEYGDGAYFGNSPAAVAEYVTYLDQGVQAYLLPKFEEDRIERVSNYAARNRKNDATTNILVFPVSRVTQLGRRITHSMPKDTDKQYWVRVPASAQAIIDKTQKYAYLGHIGVGKARFGKG